MNVARIRNGVVHNVESWEELPHATHDDFFVNIDGASCGIGWTYDNDGVFHPPTEPSATTLLTTRMVLTEIDLKAIRPLREWIDGYVRGDTAKMDMAKSFIMNNENEAIDTRKKLQKSKADAT